MKGLTYKQLSSRIYEYEGQNKKLILIVGRRYDYYAIDLYEYDGEKPESQEDLDWKKMNLKTTVIAGLSLNELRMFWYGLSANRDLNRTFA